MRWITLAVGLVLLTSANADTANFKITVKGKPAGTVRIEQNLLPGGKLRLGQFMKMATPQGEVSVDEITLLDAQGRNESTSTRITAAGKEARVEVTFDAKGANVTVTAAGKVTKRGVPQPKGASTADMSNFWFIRDKPKVGAKVTYTDFSSQNLAWSTDSTTYTGPTTITFKGKKTQAHVLATKDGKVFLDEKGMPYRVERSGGMVIERQ